METKLTIAQLWHQQWTLAIYILCIFLLSLAAASTAAAAATASLLQFCVDGTYAGHDYAVYSVHNYCLRL